jgi:protein-tyrosine phosphatase/membrane-associated phospholipid phosphatase
MTTIKPASERSVSRMAALRSSVVLGLIFVVVYGGTNEITALRSASDIGVICFAWEKYIPFVPWMILPYMSTDIFFMASPFLCSDYSEKKALEKRIVFGMLLAGICFLLFPLKCTFVKPHVDGVVGWIFAQFLTIDKPYNQLPSLHIILASILAEHYSRHTKGLVRVSLLIWFAFSAASTVLTFQHHFIDLIGGACVALLCFALFPQAKKPFIQLSSNARIGLFYATGSAVLAAIAWVCGGWFNLLLWPAASLILIALAYGSGKPLHFQKRRGKVSWYSKCLLAPVLVGQKLSWAFYARQARAWDELTAHIWIGRKLSAAEAEEAVSKGVIAVVDLTREMDEAAPFLKNNYLNVPLLDLTAPSKQQLDEAIRFINLHSKSGVVYIHCKAGYSRTAAVAAAWLLESGEAKNADDAMAKLRSVRPSMVIRPESEAFIREIAHQQIKSAARHLSTVGGRL